MSPSSAPRTSARAGSSPTGADAQIGMRDMLSPDGRRLLYALVGAPVAWTLHLLGMYVLVALFCSTGWAGGGVAILALTVLCAAAAAGSGILAVRLWRRGQRGLLADEEPGEPEGWDARLGELGARAVFLSVVAIFLAALFTYTIVIEGLPPLFAPLCEPGVGN